MTVFIRNDHLTTLSTSTFFTLGGAFVVVKIDLKMLILSLKAAEVKIFYSKSYTWYRIMLFFLVEV